MENNFNLPESLKGRTLHTNVIPTVCNLKNMLDKMVEVGGDFSKLKQWEKRSYKAYQIEDIKTDILSSTSSKWKEIIRRHILENEPAYFGASLIDIYLIAYVSENRGIGKDIFFKYVKEKGITEKANSAQAIWQVGKGDGVFLDLLYDDGSVKDREFFTKWIRE